MKNLSPLNKNCTKGKISAKYILYSKFITLSVIVIFILALIANNYVAPLGNLFFQIILVSLGVSFLNVTLCVIYNQNSLLSFAILLLSLFILLTDIKTSNINLYQWICLAKTALGVIGVFYSSIKLTLAFIKSLFNNGKLGEASNTEPEPNS
ncbi:hypothetical protein [Alistipes sp. ZOR0009]|uniref:hypothetical protein n=1 Tax=Alistipes sp. ZOR0009 TaxID=1339253 RepID=UPI000645C6B3|nr:hypothetical protein [Alistipes sp. ZOR0009]